MLVFFFSDIEGSTQKWEKHRDEMSKALARHDEVFKISIKKYGGEIVKHTGDGVFAVFDGGDPLRCAIEIEKEMARIDWGIIGEVRVRMALHAGDAEKRINDYFGPVVNRAARILSTGWGGQILVTPEVLSICAMPAQAKTKDLGQHMLKDLGEPQQLYSLLHPELKFQEFPSLRSLSAHPHNLPSQATPFLGREDELKEIERLLQMPTCRLLTIVGPGGIGKSRLALQVAADMIESFPHGVFLVPLAPLSSVQFLISAIAEQVKFSFYSRQEPKAQLLNYLSEKQMMLIMDNFEHIMDGAGIIAEILKSAPRVKILVTSREMLNLQGEWLLQVRGLKYPEGERIAISDFSAVQLFLHTARRVKADFQPSENELNYVARICQLVGGIPLGIELASSWLRILSLDEIAREIEKNLDFLSAKVRDLPERHQSLRAVFEYSWKLLSSDEGQLLARLSIFPRKFSREAAEKIAGTSLPLISSLIDKSLLSRNPSGYYEMVGVLRQYAEEKLRENKVDHGKTQKLFYEYYAVFLNANKKVIQEMSQRGLAAQISNELDNIRLAWAGIIESNDERLIEMAYMGVYTIYDLHGWLKEGLENFEKIIEGLKKKFAAKKKAMGAAENCFLCRLIARQATFLYQLGYYDKAKNLLAESAKTAQKYKDDELLSICMNLSGNVLYMLSRYEDAQSSYESWLALARELNNKNDMAGALNNLGVIAYEMHDYDKAKKLYEESRRISEEIGFNRGALFAKTNIALVLNETGNHLEAKKILKEALTSDRELNDQMSIANTLNNLGLAQKALDELDDANKSFEESLKIRQEVGDRMGITTALNNIADIAKKKGDYSKALNLQSECLRINRELNDTRGEVLSHSHFGKIYYAKKEYAVAKKYFLDAFIMARKLDFTHHQNNILLDLAHVLVAEGDERLGLELAAYVVQNEKNDESIREEARALYQDIAKKLPGFKADEDVRSAKDLKYFEKELGIKEAQQPVKKSRKKGK